MFKIIRTDGTEEILKAKPSNADLVRILGPEVKCYNVNGCDWLNVYASPKGKGINARAFLLLDFVVLGPVILMNQP
jgi:hypothetical protein